MYYSYQILPKLLILLYLLMWHIIILWDFYIGETQTDIFKLICIVNQFNSFWDWSQNHTTLDSKFNKTIQLVIYIIISYNHTYHRSRLRNKVQKKVLHSCYERYDLRRARFLLNINRQPKHSHQTNRKQLPNLDVVGKVHIYFHPRNKQVRTQLTT